MKKSFIILSLIGHFLNADATNYYVSDLYGNDNNNGFSVDSSFKTIQFAAGITLPGDTVFVLNGTYTSAYPDWAVVTIDRPGTESNWIVFTNYPNQSPVIEFVACGFNIVREARYIVINGFTIKGNSGNITLPEALNQPGGCNNPTGQIDPYYNGPGISIWGDNTNGHPHHIRISNNTIYECCNAGIGGSSCDYITIEKNILYDNSWYTLYGSSGIGFYQCWNFDNDTTNYRIRLISNLLSRNMNKVPWYVNCLILDGCGIILDDLKNTQGGSTSGPYKGKILIANNIICGSGGPGIHVFSSEHATVINNTVYSNQQTPTQFNGEIDALEANDVIVRNNIMHADTNKPINTPETFLNVVHDHNLYSGGNGTSVAGENSFHGNPGFIDPFISIYADFHVNFFSDAIDRGTDLLSPDTDFDGEIRPKGSDYDIGAYESNFFLGIPLFNTFESGLLEQNYPNPVDGFTTIKFKLVRSESISLTILDIFGNQVVCFPIRKYDAGEQMVSLDAQGLSAGIYFIKLQSSDKIESKKMIINK